MVVGKLTIVITANPHLFTVNLFKAK